MGDTFRYFDKQELACQCCGKLPYQKDVMTESQYRAFGAALDTLREAYGAPMTITSAYRCPHHNSEIGGAKSSQHMAGIAVDVAVTGADALRLVSVALALGGWYGVGVAKNFIHLDRRPFSQAALWTY